MFSFPEPTAKYGGLQPEMLALLLFLGLVWILRPQKRNHLNYEWANSSWLPRLFWVKRADQYVEKGYKEINKKKGAPFKMTWWSRENIFLTPDYLQELKTADESSLSFLKNISDAFSLHYSVGDLYDGTAMINVIRKKLNPQLPLITPLLAEEADFALEEEIGDCKDWSNHNAADVIGRIMHRMTSRILVAPEVCRDTTYLDVSLSFMNSVMITGLVAIMLPLGPLRGAFTKLLVFFHNRKLEATIKIVQPVVESRLSELEANPDANYCDAIHWAISLAGNDPHERDPRRITLNTLQNVWAGSAGPAVSVTQMIFQVLMMPEYLEPLAQEADRATREFGWTDKAMHHMPLLDSFIRECNRLYPLGSITGARTVMDESYTCHNGLVLPKGTRLAFAIGAIQKDERFLKDAEIFDGFRFSRGHMSNESEKHKSVASTIDVTNLVFGYGKHACPGRFYAIRKTKIIFAKLALKYGMRWTDIPKERPKEFPVEGQFAPNLSQRISFKSLRVE